MALRNVGFSEEAVALSVSVLCLAVRFGVYLEDLAPLGKAAYQMLMDYKLDKEEAGLLPSFNDYEKNARNALTLKKAAGPSPAKKAKGTK